VNDADTGLVYMQQRYYDPIAGRFLSVDPIVTDANTGKGFNLYEYANSNPYRFTDPDGRDTLVLQGGGGAFLGVGGEGYIGIYLSGSPKWDVGVYVSGGWGFGLSAGVAGSGGVVKGTADNLRGETVNANVSGGAFSATVAKDLQGKLAGVLVGPAAKLGGSVTDSKTSVLSLRELLEKPSANSETQKASGLEAPKPTPASAGTVQKSQGANGGFQGTFRVEGRLDSKRLDKELGTK
jgi:RHS repeat-associated protein